jgi:multiple sugar transport system permease protein
MTTTLEKPALVNPPSQSARRRSSARSVRRTVLFHTFSSLVALAWAFPIVVILVTSFRSFADVSIHGVASLPQSFSVHGYADAWSKAHLLRAFVNSMIITVPAVAAVLALASAAAFGLSRFRLPFRRTILLSMLAGAYLPVQLLLVPVSIITQQIGIFDTAAAVSVMHVVCGLGFCTFVLYGFMRSIPFELQEAATIDGAGTIRIFFRIIMPLARPPIAALGALVFTWNFNDLLWSITLFQSEAKLPTTPAVLSLQGSLISDNSLLAAATVIAALPCVIVFLLFQRSFIGGLALGAVK